MNKLEQILWLVETTQVVTEVNGTILSSNLFSKSVFNLRGVAGILAVYYILQWQTDYREYEEYESTISDKPLLAQYGSTSVARNKTNVAPWQKQQLHSFFSYLYLFYPTPSPQFFPRSCVISAIRSNQRHSSRLCHLAVAAADGPWIYFTCSYVEGLFRQGP